MFLGKVANILLVRQHPRINVHLGLNNWRRVHFRSI